MWQHHIATESSYEISKHGQKFVYDSKTWDYHNSGLARCVYRSDCGKFVIKVPICSLFDELEIDELLSTGLKYAGPSIHHNYYEAMAYDQCPEEYKPFLANTEILPNCWIRQEFVEVIKINTNRHDFREIGKREDGTYCIFDFDPLLRDFKFMGYKWEKLPRLIEMAVNSIVI